MKLCELIDTVNCNLYVKHLYNSDIKFTLYALDEDGIIDFNYDISYEDFDVYSTYYVTKINYTNKGLEVWIKP